MLQKRNVFSIPHLVEDDGGALPWNTVLPVVVGGVHRGAAKHASDGAGGIGAVIGDASPGGRGADITGVVMSQEGLDAHELLGDNEKKRRVSDLVQQNEVLTNRNSEANAADTDANTFLWNVVQFAGCKIGGCTHQKNMVTNILRCLFIYACN